MSPSHYHSSICIVHQTALSKLNCPMGVSWFDDSAKFQFLIKNHIKCRNWFSIHYWLLWIGIDFPKQRWVRCNKSIRKLFMSLTFRLHLYSVQLSKCLAIKPQSIDNNFNITNSLAINMHNNSQAARHPNKAIFIIIIYLYSLSHSLVVLFRIDMITVDCARHTNFPPKMVHMNFAVCKWSIKPVFIWVFRNESCFVRCISKYTITY